MKTNRSLKWFAVLGCTVLVFTGCLKTKDPQFFINVATAYVVQEGVSENAVFAPYMLVWSPTMQIQSATVEHRTNKYGLTKIGPYGNMVESSFSGYTGIPFTDTLPKGPWIINASDAKNRVSEYKLNFSLRENQKMGKLEVTSFSYTKADGISATWNPVENSTEYGLVITPVYQMEDGTTITMGNTLYNWTYKEKDNRGGKFNPGNAFQDGQLLRVSVAAFSGNEESMPNIVVLKSSARLITWGTDYDGELPPVPDMN